MKKGYLYTHLYSSSPYIDDRNLDLVSSRNCMAADMASSTMISRVIISPVGASSKSVRASSTARVSPSVVERSVGFSDS
jgi:hypothetical protein